MGAFLFLGEHEPWYAAECLEEPGLLILSRHNEADIDQDVHCIVSYVTVWRAKNKIHGFIDNGLPLLKQVLPNAYLVWMSQKRLASGCFLKSLSCLIRLLRCSNGSPLAQVGAYYVQKLREELRMGLDGLSVLHTHPDNPGVENLLETGTGKEDLLALRSFEKPSAKPKEVVTHLWVEGYLG